MELNFASAGNITNQLDQWQDQVLWEECFTTSKLTLWYCTCFSTTTSHNLALVNFHTMDFANHVLRQ